MKRKIEQTNGVNQIHLQNSDGNTININMDFRDKLKNLIANGHDEEVISLFENLNEMIRNDMTHPLKPYYYYDLQKLEGKYYWKHQPANKNIERQMPLNYKGVFTIDEEYMPPNESITDALNRIYYEQEAVKINVSFLETWIGETKVSNDYFTKQLMQGDVDWFAIPQDGPPVLKVNVSIGEKIVIDYLELSVTKKSISERVLEVSNKRQENAPFDFSFELYLDETGGIVKESDANRVKFSIRNNFIQSVRSRRIYWELIKFSSDTKNGLLSIKELEQGVLLLESPDFNYDQDIISDEVEDYLRYLYELEKIEREYGVQFDLPDEITKEDDEVIQVLSSTLDGDPHVYKWYDWTFYLEEVDQVKNILDKYKTIGHITFFTNEYEVEVFGVAISNVYQEFYLENAMLKNPDLLSKKFELMDTGEKVKIDLVPAEKEGKMLVYHYNNDVESSFKTNL